MTEPFIEQSDRETPSLSELFDIRERQLCGKIHTGMVARVISYDPSPPQPRCNLQPVHRQRFDNGDTQALPVLPRVPVQFPQGGGFAITWPLVKGDEVWVSFSERSLDEWKAEGGTDITPQDLRRFDLSDAVAYPGISSPGSPLASASATRMVLGEDDPAGAKLQFAGGKVALGTPSADLVLLVDALVAAVDVFTTGTIAAVVEPTLGPSSVALKAALVPVIAALASIKGPLP